MQIAQKEIDRYADELFEAGHGEIRHESWFTSKSPEAQSEIVERGRAQAAKMAGELAKAISECDVRALEIRLHSGNRHSCAAFERITGIKLGRTNKSIREGIARFVGTAAYAQYEADREAEANRRAGEARQKNEQAKLDAALGERCRWLYTLHDDGRTTSGIEMRGTMREFIEWLVANGFQSWREAKRGFRSILEVHDPSDRIRTVFVLDKKAHRDHFARLLAEKEQAATCGEPDIATK